MITKDKPVSESLSEAIISTLEGVPGVVITTKLNSTNFTVKKEGLCLHQGRWSGVEAATGNCEAPCLGEDRYSACHGKADHEGMGGHSLSLAA
jgi:hypothetical protein